MLSWCRRSGKGGGRRELQRGHDAGKQEDVFFIVHLGRRSLYAYRLPLAPRHIHTSIRLINFPTRFTYRAHRQVTMPISTPKSSLLLLTGDTVVYPTQTKHSIDISYLWDNFKRGGSSYHPIISRLDPSDDIAFHKFNSVMSSGE